MGSENNDEEIVIRVRGLPWSATAEDVVKFFDGIPILNGEKGVHMTLSREGRPSGEAYVELENPDDLQRAEKKHNQHMGRRYIEVLEAKRSEMEWVIKRSGMSSGHESDCCVRLRGLPFGCSKEEIMQFFGGLEIVPNGIALPTDYQGRHTGEAYVQFTNEVAAQKAMSKHKEKIAHRYIEIFNCNLTEIRAAMSPKVRGPGGGFNRPSPYDSRDRYGGSNRYGSGGRGSRSGRMYQPEPMVKWPYMYNNRGGGGGSGRMGGNRDGGMKDFGGRNSGPTCGHFVHMRGLPFRATEYDIADFFRPCNPININIQMDSTNRPSGEADVEFSSHEEALKAMNKDKANMQSRYIELFLNSTPTSGTMGVSSAMGGCGPMGGTPDFDNNAANMGGYGGNMGNPGYGSGMGRINSGGGRPMMNNRMGGFGNNMGMAGTMNDGPPAMGYNAFGAQGGHNQMTGSNYNSFC